MNFFELRKKICRTIRSVISLTETLNKDVFSTFLMPAGYMEEHCIGVSTPSTWTAQVEVVTTATIFRVLVYFCTITLSSVDYCRWNVIHPLKGAKYELRYPLLPDLDKSILYWDQITLNCFIAKYMTSLYLLNVAKCALTHLYTLSGCHSKLIDLTM